MKQPKEIKAEHALCGSCNKPIHISELAMIGKGKNGGMALYHGNSFCLLDAIKSCEKEIDNLNPEFIKNPKKVLKEKPLAPFEECYDDGEKMELKRAKGTCCPNSPNCDCKK